MKWLKYMLLPLVALMLAGSASIARADDDDYGRFFFNFRLVPRNYEYQRYYFYPPEYTAPYYDHYYYRGHDWDDWGSFHWDYPRHERHEHHERQGHHGHRG